MMKLVDDRLECHFPEVHPDARLEIELHRTLRPQSGRAPASPRLGRYPLRDVDGRAERIRLDGDGPRGVFFCMHQAEAVRVRFAAPRGYPFAVKLTLGTLDVFSGERARGGLAQSFANYRVILHAREIAGRKLADGSLAPLVAASLTRRPSMADQLAGDTEDGRLQIAVYPMIAARYAALSARGSLCGPEGAGRAFGPDAWDHARHAHCFVHLVNSRQYVEITGRTPPCAPPTADDFARAGLPWNDSFEADRNVLATVRRLVLMDAAPTAYAARAQRPMVAGERALRLVTAR